VLPAVRSGVGAGARRVCAPGDCDGAAGGRPVLIVLQVRRFRCRNPACTAVTFAEQAGELSERYRRRSVPLTAMLAGFWRGGHMPGPGRQLRGGRPGGRPGRDPGR
jgi:hypothetical protein